MSAGSRSLDQPLPLLHQALRGQVSPISLLRYLLVQRYGLPDLLWMWPRTVRRVVDAARTPASSLGGSLFAFTPFDLFIRSYYAKMARNFRTAGRFGYVWDEALGLPMGPRYFLNTVTYWVYGALSPRAFSILSTAAFLLSIVLAGALAGAPLQGLVIALLLLGTPGLLFGQLAYGVKPEVLWWAFATPALVAAAIGQWHLAAGAAGALLFVNTSVSVILSGLLIAVWLLLGITGRATLDPLWLLWLAPGTLKQALRLSAALLDGFLRQSTRDQRRASAIAYRRGVAAYAGVPLAFVLPLAVAGWQRWDLAAALGVATLAFYTVNSQVIKVADVVTVRLVFLCVVCSAALAAQSWWGIAGVVLAAAAQPTGHVRYGSMFGARAKRDLALRPAADVEERTAQERDLLRGFPWIRPMALPAPPALVAALGQIPDGSRLLMESAGDPRVENAEYWRFHDWAYNVLAPRHVEFINQTYLLRTAEPQLAETYLNRFTTPAVTPEVMAQLMAELGSAYLIAFSARTVAGLAGLGFHEIACVAHEEMAALVDLLHMPERDLVLLAHQSTPSIVSVISVQRALEEPVSVRRGRNSLTWDAVEGATYHVRYRYHAAFRAHQEGHEIRIQPYRPREDLPLTFMKFTASASGPVEVRFHARLAPLARCAR